VVPQQHPLKSIRFYSVSFDLVWRHELHAVEAPGVTRSVQAVSLRYSRLEICATLSNLSPKVGVSQPTTPPLGRVLIVFTCAATEHNCSFLPCSLCKTFKREKRVDPFLHFT
jgi:hypothetical protein